MKEEDEEAAATAAAAALVANGEPAPLEREEEAAPALPRRPDVPPEEIWEGERGVSVEEDPEAEMLTST